jgi:hypothetical protein
MIQGGAIDFELRVVSEIEPYSWKTAKSVSLDLFDSIVSDPDQRWGVAMTRLKQFQFTHNGVVEAWIATRGGLINVSQRNGSQFFLFTFTEELFDVLAELDYPQGMLRFRREKG